ncbi:MAG: AraC family transcriptional regulator [Marmoricola sp.]
MDDQDPADGLTDALNRLQITGALFLFAHYTEGWAYSAAPRHAMTEMLAPHARSVVPFHIITAGRCWIEVDGERFWADAGDVVVIPYARDHSMGGTEDAELIPVGSLLSPPPWTTMPYIDYGQGGDVTEIVCGYVVAETPLFDPDLRALPPVVVVTPTGAAAEWVRASGEYALAQTRLSSPESAETPAVLVQALFVEALRLHLSNKPSTSAAGFLGALHDPVLAPAVARIHGEPERKWTVADLASAALVSPSLLDERFRTVLGMPPIRYLTAWRMHLAQDLLSTSDLGVATVARRVGYESEEAFSRAFKRKHGVAPSVWRKTPA